MKIKWLASPTNIPACVWFFSLAISLLCEDVVGDVDGASGTERGDTAAGRTDDIAHESVQYGLRDAIERYALLDELEGTVVGDAKRLADREGDAAPRLEIFDFFPVVRGEELLADEEYVDTTNIDAV